MSKCPHFSCVDIVGSVCHSQDSATEGPIELIEVNFVLNTSPIVCVHQNGTDYQDCDQYFHCFF